MSCDSLVYKVLLNELVYIRACYSSRLVQLFDAVVWFSVNKQTHCRCGDIAQSLRLKRASVGDVTGCNRTGCEGHST